LVARQSFLFHVLLESTVYVTHSHLIKPRLWVVEKQHKKDLEDGRVKSLFFEIFCSLENGIEETSN
jgi:hypothetical protein